MCVCIYIYRLFCCAGCAVQITQCAEQRIGVLTIPICISVYPSNPELDQSGVSG